MDSEADRDAARLEPTQQFGTLPKKLAPWAGLRNRIVHEYEEIKDKLVFDKIEPTITNFRKYIREED